MREGTSESQDILIETRDEQHPNEGEKNYNNDAGYVSSSDDSLNANTFDDETWRLNIPPKLDKLKEEESLKFLKEAKIDLEKIPEEERRKWLVDLFIKHYGSVMPKSLIELTASHYFNGDSGIGVDVKPDWLDIDKFQRGQKLATDNLLGVFYANVISLFTVFSFDEGLKPLILTDASSTPYTAFKRYLSTITRIQNWYTSDPWTAGTVAYNDIRAVRRMHAMVRKKMHGMSNDEYVEKASIKNAWCPALKITRRDFESTCAAPKPRQRPYTTITNVPELHMHKVSQSDMVATQFSFVGLLILNPKFFGVHDTADEDIEAYCHVWRGLGYLLGIDDDFNFCRGTLEDVRTRSRDFLEYWVKPNFRVVQPQWEHMMRCLIEGLQYYFPLVTYESCLLDVAEIMNLHMPRTYNSLSYPLWFKYNLIRFYFNQGAKISGLKSFMNCQLSSSLERARNYDKQKHQELKGISARTIDRGIKKHEIPLE